MSISNSYWSDAIGDDSLILSSNIIDAYNERVTYGDYEDANID